MDLRTKVNGFLLGAGGGLIWQVAYTASSSGYDSLRDYLIWQGYYPSSRPSCFSTYWDWSSCKVRLMSGSCRKLLCAQIYVRHLLICLSPLISNMFLLQCKESSMPWSFPSSTPEVSQFPAGCLSPGDPRVQSCLSHLWQSPDPSAALVIPTRTKSASTIVTWTSSGSTPPSKTYPVECEAIKL